MLANKREEKKYGELIDLLLESNVPFMIAGAFALGFHTGYWRDTKDLDIFCKHSDSILIAKYLQEKDFKVEITDSRWLAKAYNGKHFIDIIHASFNNTFIVNESWFEHAKKAQLFGREVQIVSAEELIYSKAYVQQRVYFQGPDLNHIILRQGENLDWKRIQQLFDHHWQFLFSILLNFRFVYPSERDIIPTWLIETLTNRLKAETELPTPTDKVCLGPLLSRNEYEIDLKEWGFKTIT